MELNVYQYRVEEIKQKIDKLRELENSLHILYAEEHPWNVYKGRKVRVKNTITGEYSEWGYMVSVWPNDEKVGFLLCRNVKKDGSMGQKEVHIYFNHNAAEIEVE